MRDPGERQAETSDGEQPVTNISRRRVLQASVGALVVGLTVVPSAGAQGSVPGYADYLPAGVDEIVL